MKIKYAIFAVSIVFLVFPVSSASGVVNIRQIDRVRNKEVLDTADFQVIDDFVAGAVAEMVKTTSFTSVARIRTIILSRNCSNKDSAQAQYTEQFFESAKKHISSGFEEASQLTSEDRRFKATLNLLILVDNLQDIRLIDPARDKLNDQNTAICYWAVHSVTNPAIIERLNSGGQADSELAAELVEQLKGLVNRASPEILALMAKFTVELNIEQSEDLLLKIADKRISEYANWTVERELLDATVLKLLYGKLSSGAKSSAIARRFGQLYSYAIQRYIKDINGGNFLTAEARKQLISVLVETEKSCIAKKPLGISQSTIQKAVERGDYKSLLLEHNRLLGDETKAGLLGSEIKFDYGGTSGGTRRTSPLTLPAPPGAGTGD